MRPPEPDQQLLNEARVVLVSEPKERRRFQKLLNQHHCLGGLKAVGEQVYCAALDVHVNWLAILLFSAASKHLKHRDQWIGWPRAQRDRRLSLAANNSRFLVLPQMFLALLCDAPRGH